MYYRTVNRGVVITGPGRWTIALIMTLGVIAIVSGYNGVYLSLSVGAAILVVSGVLSERFMKSYSVERVHPVVAEAGAPFTVEALVSNQDPNSVVYGMENLFYTQVPRWGILREDANFCARSLSLVLPPGKKAKVSGQCTGMERGHYQQWHVVQRTLYPFGLVSKFKVGEVPADVLVLPPYLEDFGEEIRRLVQQQFQMSDSESEFHSHRAYNPEDSARSVDWKRSAGRSPKDWVVKNRQTRSSRVTVLIAATRSWIDSSDDRELHLAQLRTAMDVVLETGREVGLELDGNFLGRGRLEVCRALASYPTPPAQPLGDFPSGEIHRLWVDGTPRWGQG